MKIAAQKLFFRNLATAIAKRFKKPVVLGSRKEHARKLMEKHFSEQPKTLPLENQRPREQLLGEALQPRKISPVRVKKLEEKIKLAVNPERERKKKIADHLSEKITVLERRLSMDCIPYLDRLRLQELINRKKTEISRMRMSL